MRYSICLQLVRHVGLFWGSRLMPYARPMQGWSGAPGYSRFWRHLMLVMLEGAWHAPLSARAGRVFLRTQNVAYWGLLYAPPHVENPLQQAWQLMRHLKLRTARGARYRLALPARGQRTRSNAQTCKRHGGGA